MNAGRNENRNCWAAVYSIPADGLAGQDSVSSHDVGLEARETPTPAVKGEDFSLDFPFYRTSEWRVIQLPSGSLRCTIIDLARGRTVFL